MSAIDPAARWHSTRQLLETNEVVVAFTVAGGAVQSFRLSLTDAAHCATSMTQALVGHMLRGGDASLRQKPEGA